jgi:hypothetical protein
MTAAPGRVKRAGALCLAAAALGVASPAGWTWAGELVHGSDAVYVGRGVGVLWGVLRGPDEARTRAVLRIVPLPGAPEAVAVEGVDPFVSARRRILSGVLLSGPREVRIPRSAFAEYPRIELHFAVSPAAATGEAASFTIYFNGLPDTAPEFQDEASLAAYLRDALERALAQPGGAKP